MDSIQLPNDQIFPEIIRLLDDGHTVTIPLRGWSMRPFLEHDRDKAVLAMPTDIKVGDVVLAEVSPGKYVLHRLVALRQGTAILRGDGNIGTETCRQADIRAVAIAFYRKGRQKPDRTDGAKWRTYSILWTRLTPIRRYLLYIVNRTMKKRQYK